MVVNVINEEEGITLSFKTIAKGDNGVLVTGDNGLYNVEELVAALTEVKNFTRPAPTDFTEGEVNGN
jgi:hypothetical protein